MKRYTLIAFLVLIMIFIIVMIISCQLNPISSTYPDYPLPTNINAQSQDSGIDAKVTDADKE